jgi:hypothetical protein
MPTGERKWWLCVVPAIVCALDAGLTLVFQSPAYWAGELYKVNEFSPPDRWMLERHPLLFVAWVGAWIAAFSLAIRLLPTRASLALAVILVLGNSSGASWWLASLPGGFWLGFGLFVASAVLLVLTWVKAGILTPANKPAVPTPAADRRGIRLVAGLAVVLALACALATVLVPKSPNPVAVLGALVPGMTYQDVQAVLLQPEVAGPLASSFGSPVKEAQAVLRGEPSFEKQEWGRVDSALQYEAEWARDWKVQNPLPVSTSERRKCTVRQWGVGNTQSYSFTAVFDEKDMLICRYWTVPSESRFRGWIRRTFGL